MKIIRWLLSHIILILVIVVVIYGYMFWGNLAGEDTPAGKAIAYLADEFDVVDEFVEAVKEKNAQSKQDDTESAAVVSQDESDISRTEVQPQSQTESQPESQSEGQVTEIAPEEATAQIAPADSADESSSGGEVQTSAAAAASQKVEKTPVNISYRHNNVQIQQDNDGVIAEQEVSTAAQPAIALASPSQTQANTARQSPAKQSGDLMTSRQGSVSDIQAQSVNNGDFLAKSGEAGASSFVSPEIEQQLKNVDEHGKIIDQSLRGGEVRKTWITARKSYYQRNYALSEKSYKRVIELTDDNFDAYGELGNVYFNQGKKAQAASAYYEAAAIMVKKGQSRRARSLMGLMRHLDKTKAEQLQELLDTATSKQVTSKK